MVRVAAATASASCRCLRASACSSAASSSSLSSVAGGRAALAGLTGRRRRRAMDPRPCPVGVQGLQARDFHVPMPWDGRRKAREDAELEQISRMESVMKALDGPLALAPSSSFRQLVDEQGQGARDAEPKKEEFQQWLTAAEAELGGLAKQQMGVFSGGEWWTEGHEDYKTAAQALHCLQLQQLCAEIKKSKAVFTPHIPGDRLMKGVVARVVHLLRANIEGDLEGRLRASWALQDDSAEGSGLLSEQGMEDAIYTALNPTVATAAALYPALPAVTKKAQKKAFAKYVKFYMRDQADFPTKLRCIFHWAERPPEPVLETPPPVPPPRVVSFEAYLQCQKENFPDLHQVGAGVPSLYRRVREAHYNQKKDDRDTFRTGVVYLIGLGFADAYVSML